MKYLIFKKNIFRNLFLLVSISIGFFTALNVNAASLYFSPSSGSFATGDTFKVSVSVDTQNVAINSVELNINFPADLLSVVSTSKTNSILSFVIQEPTFSNTTGDVSFSGGLPTPGFTGLNGKILEILFKVKKSGMASLTFSSSVVRANDGLGTYVLQSSGNAKFTLNPAINIPKEEPKKTVTVLPQSFNISSSTNPDPNKWYNNPNPKFAWTLLSDITAVRLSYDKYSNSIPNSTSDVVYYPPISEKELANVGDGTFYLHVQLKDKNSWNMVSHFKFNIDTVKPSVFNISEITREDTTEPEAKFIFNAKDELSGIDYFEIQIDDKPWDIWKDDGTHQYNAPALGVGKHTLIAKVFDKAGNFANNSAVFIIDSIKSPNITEYPKELTTSESLIIKGLTYPSSQVTVWLQKDGSEAESSIIESGKTGEFLFVNQIKLSDGIYSAWADVLDSRGARSLPSEKVIITVTKPLFFRIGSFAVDFLTFLIPLVSLIVFLMLIIWFSWHKYRILRKRIRRETHNIEEDIHKSFSMLKYEIGDYLKMLEKAKSERALTPEEEKIIKQLNETLNLDKSEDVIEKEILNIKKEVE